MANGNTLPIEKIRIYPVLPDLREKIYCHFGQYGEIESIDYYSEGNSGYAFLQFKEAASIEATIAKREHQIGNEMVNATATLIRHWYPQTIFILNDNCIQEIFGKLSLQDLTVVAEVCTRFKPIAENVFSSKFANIDVLKHFPEMGNDSDTDTSDDEGENEVFNPLMKRLFRNFGSLMQSLYLTGQFKNGNFNDRIFKLMSLYCSNEHSELTKLTLDDFKMKIFPKSLLEQMKPLFRRLKHLGLSYGSHYEELSQLMSDCRELTDLILIEVPFDEFLKIKFDKLESIRLRGAGVKDNTISRLGQSNPQIKNLAIDSKRVGIKAKIFYILRSKFPNLENLAILHGITMNAKRSKESISHLAALKHLKGLMLNCYGLPVPEIIDTLTKGKVPIEHLILSNFEVDSNTANSISKMDQLKALQFNRVRVGSDHLIKMVKDMPKMRSLALMKSGRLTVTDIKEIAKASNQFMNELSTVAIINTKRFVFDVQSFMAITESIKNRANNTKLNITVGLRGLKLVVPQKVVEENRKWLHIKEIWSKDGSNYFNDDSPHESEDDMDFDDDEESDEESESALTNDNDRANGNDPLIYQFSQEQRKFESFLILRTGHELGISSQFSSDLNS